MNYRLIASATPGDLETEVNAAMVEGWQCQGGVSMILNAFYYLYAQAMVKQ